MGHAGLDLLQQPQLLEAAAVAARLSRRVPDDRMLLLDLFCDANPSWDKTEAFYGKPWVWCMLHNFGGVPGMWGDLKQIAEGPSLALAIRNRGRLEGIGIMMEAIEQNPVVYELMLESAWRSEPHDARAWVHQYARRRYGADSADAQKAWDILLDTVYSAKSPSSFVFWRRPELEPKSERRNTEQVGDALGLLLSCSEQFGKLATYRHDIADVAVQWLGDLNTLQLRKVADAYKAGDKTRFEAEREGFLTMLRDMDAIQATRRETTLGKWIDEATRWARTDEERRHYEWNARDQITLWGPADSVLHDYARKNWAGLISSFYLPRWEKLFKRLDESRASGKTFDAAAFEQEIRAWENEWTHATGGIGGAQGDTLEVVRALYEKYAPR